ncbi:heme-binding protein [bacterium]|nr:heme-binding protein [bacterium]MCI0603218.1 heme-binding protein [bacterium]
MKYSLLVFVLLFAVTSGAQVVEKKGLSLQGAKIVIAAAQEEAKKLNAPGGVIAVVDEGGNLVAVERLDNTFAAGANISIGKARTSAIFKRPTKVFEDVIKNGRTSMVALADFTPLQGGVPIMIDGQLIGAVGVSGAASAEQDEQLAIAGANALMNSKDMSMASVTYLDNKKVSAAFVKGMPLIEVENYKVHASHRDSAGMAEVHEKDTDIIYVLEGTATFVTGGKVVEGKTTAQDEIRGASIDGGDTRKIVKGDVIIVPSGTPHWFKQATNPFNYYVVKVAR